MIANPAMRAKGGGGWGGRCLFIAFSEFLKTGHFDASFRDQGEFADQNALKDNEWQRRTMDLQN